MVSSIKNGLLLKNISQSTFKMVTSSVNQKSPKVKTLKINQNLILKNF